MSEGGQTLYDPLLPPHEMVQKAHKKHSKKEPGCMVFIKRFDEYILRPIFIHRYEKDKREKAFEFYDLLMHDGARIRSLY